MFGKVKKVIRKSSTIIRNEGLVKFGIRTLTKIDQKGSARSSDQSRKKGFVSLVDRESVMAADWTTHPYKIEKSTVKRKNIISWIMSPPSSGGGHQNIFRFIEYLDKQGYENHIYLYSTFDDMTTAQARDNVKVYCSAKNIKFSKYNGSIVDSDTIFATGWETAYPVFNLKTSAKKMYFVQDFEPYFYPMGTEYILAENTYKFGFHGITAGGWLSEKLSSDYGMECDHYEFGADSKLYKYINKKERNEIFFYARPVTERRGFDLGIMALEIFHNKMPDIKINLAGWDVSGWDIPFPYVNHKTLQIEELPEIYNNCSAALVLSLTNMSLLPLELLASGTIPVVNEGANNRLVSNNPYIAYTEASPEALAQSLIDVVTNQDLAEYSMKASESVEKDGWKIAGDKFVKILDKELGDV